MAAPDDFKFSTFSAGVHRCPGQRVALEVMEISLALLLLEFGLELDGSGPPPGLCFERATLAQRKGPVRCTCSLRLQS